MNRAQLAKALAQKTKMSVKNAEKLIIAFGDTLSDALTLGEKIIYSNFGTFYTVHYPSKVIYHPVFGKSKKMIMLPTDSVKWMPSDNVKAIVASGTMMDNATKYGAAKEFSQSVGQPISQSASQPTGQLVSQPVSQEAEPVPEIKPPVSETKIAPEQPADIEIQNKFESGAARNLEVGHSINTKSLPDNIVKTSPVDIFHTSSSKINLEGDSGIANAESGTLPTGRQVEKAESKEQDLDVISTPPDSRRAEKSDSTIEPPPTPSLRHSETPISETPILSRSLSNEIVKEVTGTIEVDKSKKENDQEDKEATFKKNTGFWEQLFHRADAETSTPDSPSPPTTETPSADSVSIFGKRDDLTPGITPKPDSNTPSLSNSVTPSLENSVTPPAESPALSTTLSTHQKNIDYLDLSKITVPKELLSIIPEKVAREYKIAPVSQTETELVLGMVDPEDIEALEIVKKIAQKKVTPKLVTESDITHILEQYQAFESEIEEAIEDVDETGKIEKAKEVKNGEIPFSVSDSAPAARIVSSLLKRAIRDNASDVHIEPAENEVVARFRIDGVLQKKASLPKDIQSAVISRIKILANLKIDEQRLPQDGRFSLKTDDRKVDFRVSTMPVANGEKIVMRILDKTTGVIALDSLGFRPRDLEVIAGSIKKSHGMVLVTGPTGSGKTTTLYALIGKIYAEGINIITLEDPIEYQISGVNQSQVNPDIDYTFASGLRSILRQDPDVVMIGEIRDNETAEMAIHAALTGHIVLSTLHTNDSAGAIPRLIDMSVEPFLLNSSLNVVIAQRLARRVCGSCKEKFTLAEADQKLMKEEIAKLPAAQKSEIPADFVFYHGKGCKECGESGYKGRIGLYEVLEVSPKIRELASQKSSGAALQETAISEGMSTMIQDGIIKALQGLTSIEEVWRVTKE